MLPVVRARIPFGYGANLALNATDSLFDRLFGEDGDSLRRTGVAGPIPITMWHDEEKLVIEADLPGVEESDLEILVHGGVMTIKSERRPAENRNYVYNARSHGQFEQRIVLPDTVDGDQVDATLKAGVLEITLRKHAEAKPKKVTVRTA